MVEKINQINPFKCEDLLIELEYLTNSSNKKENALFFKEFIDKEFKHLLDVTEWFYDLHINIKGMNYTFKIICDKKSNTYYFENHNESFSLIKKKLIEINSYDLILSKLDDVFSDLSYELSNKNYQVYDFLNFCLKNEKITKEDLMNTLEKNFNH